MLKIYRQNNFEQPHEREKFRKICNMLSDQFKDSKEDIYVFANVRLPKSTYTYEFDGKKNKKTVRDSNPDMFILKNNGAVLIELKNYPGTISWNPDNLTGKDTWTSKLVNRPSQIINEGSANPYLQTKYNRQALIGFLQTNDSKFISKKLNGNWYNLIPGNILFTHDKVKFAGNYTDLLDIPTGSWDPKISVSSLLKDNNSAYFPEYIEDNVVTAPRGYIKTKDRKKATQDEIDAVNLPRIAFDNKSIEKIVKILKCKDVTSKYIGDIKEDVLEDLTISTGLGFAPTLVHEREESIEVLDKIPKPSKEILSLPTPLRTLLYYKQSIFDESKNQSMDLYVNTRNAHKNIFLLKNMYDTIFSKNKPFSIAEDVIQDIEINLKEEDPSLSYGLGLHVNSKIWMKRTLYTVEPLFSTSVIFEKGSYRPSLENDLTINDSVLRRLPNFNNITKDEYFDKKDKIMQEHLNFPENIIRAIYSEAGIDSAKDFDPFRIHPLDTRNPQRGFKPNTAAIYLSQSNFYKRLISELDLIYSNWKKKYDNGEEIDDLAFNFLDNFDNYQNIDKTKDKWNPPLFNILDSNYEQSKAVGIATNLNIPISVVSGPPGTGKSQFSINTIAEMNYKDKSVIFSSKNGKAVDVVSDKMNKIAPESINRLNKTDQNVEFEKFEHEPLKVPERQKLKTLINNNSSSLSKIKDKIEKFEKALLEIDSVENEINDILNTNSKLNLINWFSEDSSILNVEFWKSKLADSEASKKKGFFGRAIEVLTSENENFSLYDIIDQESFIEKNSEIIINELKDNLPKEIISKIEEEEDLISFSKNYLYLIEKLDALSQKLKLYIEIIDSNSGNEFYNEWGTVSSKNTKSTLSLYNDKIFAKNRIFTNKSITTLSVGKVIDSNSGIFDLAIFDEASQTDIISALPILFRAKKVLVIGDEKQLNPIISVRNEKDLINWHAYNLPEEIYDKYSYTSNSLLSTSDKIIKSHNMSRTILKEHYRCHPDIINFSNRFFYDNILRVKTEQLNDGGIEFISHNGDCQKPPDNRSWINEEEIILVIDKLLNLKKSLSCKDIGVVTPFRAQAMEIKNRISKLESFTENDLINLTIDTAHKFQGDEKKVMIYSLTAGPSMSEKTYSWMSGGDASNPHERNLINVAVTRARSKLYIIGNENFILSKSGLLTELINWTYFCNRKSEL